MTRPPARGARRLTLLALFTAIALTIFMVEAQIPVPIPIPGVKLGLANIVTVYVMFVLGPGDALLVLSARVFLGAVFSGQMSTLLYSAGGGLLCWLALCLLRRVLSREQIWLCSPVAAIFHNLGQLLVAAGVMKTWAVLAYLPYLVMAGAAAVQVGTANFSDPRACEKITDGIAAWMQGHGVRSLAEIRGCAQV